MHLLLAILFGPPPRKVAASGRAEPYDEIAVADPMPARELIEAEPGMLHSGGY